MTPRTQLDATGRSDSRPANLTATDAPTAGGDSTTTPRYVRISEVERIFGLKRSSIYNLLADGRITGCSVRIRGERSRVRLIDLTSVQNFINQEKQTAKDQPGNE